MKTASQILTMLILLFLFSALVANPLLCSAADAVLDTDGNKVRTGTDYYVVPVVRSQGGGLSLASTSKNGTKCPLDVVQEPQEANSGLPLTISLVKGHGVVPVSTDLNVVFSASTICVQSTVWKLADYDQSAEASFVTIGGVVGNPGRETLSNWFKIENFEDGYRINFCPTVCDICRPICGDVGVYVTDNGTKRLALSDVPLKVMFKKV